MSGQSWLLLMIVGGIAGWLAGLVMRGSGYGIIGDIVVGLVGAFVGNHLIGFLKIPLSFGNSWLDLGVISFVGAVILLFVVGFLRPRRFGERVRDLFRRR